MNSQRESAQECSANVKQSTRAAHASPHCRVVVKHLSLQVVRQNMYPLQPSDLVTSHYEIAASYEATRADLVISTVKSADSLKAWQ